MEHSESSCGNEGKAKLGMHSTD